MQKETKNINHFKSVDAFKVPDDYFESFVYNLQHNLKIKKKESQFFRLNLAQAFRLMIPSVLVFLLCVITFFIPKNKNSLSLNINDIETYILNENEYELLDEYESLLAINLNFEKSTISEEQIIDYLLDEELEFELINP